MKFYRSKLSRRLSSRFPARGNDEKGSPEWESYKGLPPFRLLLRITRIIPSCVTLEHSVLIYIRNLETFCLTYSCSTYCGVIPIGLPCFVNITVSQMRISISRTPKTNRQPQLFSLSKLSLHLAGQVSIGNAYRQDLLRYC